MSSLAEKISESELEVMRVLWRAGEAMPLADIRHALKEKTNWESTTIKTLIQRLCSKGALEQQRRSVFYYRPLISEQEYGDWATKKLIRSLYGGSAKELAAALVRSDGLTSDDVEELRAMFLGEGRR